MCTLYIIDCNMIYYMKDIICFMCYVLQNMQKHFILYLVYYRLYNILFIIIHMLFDLYH